METRYWLDKDDLQWILKRDYVSIPSDRGFCNDNRPERWDNAMGHRFNPL